MPTPSLHPSALPRSFRPLSPWSGPHAQTLLGKLLRQTDAPPLRRERWSLPDGDFIDLDFAPDPHPDAPLTLVLHGLEGNARRGYCVETYRALAARGIAAVGMNFRACSGEPNLKARAYHSGDTGDLAEILGGLRVRFPDRPLMAVGFSLGGNVLLKYLGEQGDADPVGLAGAVAVSVPYDLEAGARRLEDTPLGRHLYSRYFLRSLQAKTRQKVHLLDGLDLDRVLASRTIREFDDALTAPLHGFAGAEEYYRASSSAGFLEGIRVPTLLLHATDDPFLPASAVPGERMAANPWLHPVITERGGHVGFVGGSLRRPRFWAEDSASRFLAGVAEAS